MILSEHFLTNFHERKDLLTFTNRNYLSSMWSFVVLGFFFNQMSATSSPQQSQLVTADSNEALYNTIRKNLPKTLDQLIFCKHTLNILKFTKYLVNVLKFTKYLVNSYHQKDVKHYVLTN